ncbi:MAG: VWA domain-containing protein [Acidobacteriota bacterium]|nr:VWA domain-containing protein [Acidobacteriota bacterium]
MRLRAILLASGWAAVTVVGAAQEPATPRFRAGANLVHVDAYVAKNGVALTDLRPEDIEVYEDDKLQTIESVELIKARGPIPQSERINPTTVRDMQQDGADAARLFTLFFDRYHVSVAGSYHANKPIIQTLDKVIGQDDMVGVMTPEMSATSITYSRRTTNIERYVTDSWAWGIKDQVATLSPAEQAFHDCYPQSQYPSIAAEMVARMREQRTLDALDALVLHLEGLRPERKFVLVFTEGWPLYQRSDRLARPLNDAVPGQDPLRVNPLTGGIAKPGSPDTGRGMSTSYQACERQRAMLANIDHQTEFRTLLQRANRANVSFYPIDARGLIVFDQPTRFDLPPSVDQVFLRKRHDDLRMMALQTDGLAVLDSTNDIAGAMQRIFGDVGSYYLLRYYSSNTKLDGKFRRIRVEVKRPAVDVRSRPGYLAPTEAEARAAGGAAVGSKGRPGAVPAPPPPPPAVTRALDAIAPGRGNLPVRIQASGARSSIRAVVELDAATIKLPEWMSGGTLRLVIDPERGTTAATQTITTAIQPGQRSIPIAGTDAPLPPGRYSVRAELTPKAGRLPIQVTTFATVPAESADLGTGALALRRGPSTGLAYVPTADPRFRRTERLRVEVPLIGEGHTGTARLLTREGQPMPLVASFTTRVDEEKAQALGVAEVNLAPLAAGEYVLEVSIVKDGKTGLAAYGFRIIP